MPDQKTRVAKGILASRERVLPGRFGWTGAWATILALALWLAYLVPMWLAIAVVGSATWTISAFRARYIPGVVLSILLWAATIVAAGVQLQLSEIADDWSSLRPRVEDPLAGALGVELEALVDQGEEAVAGAAAAAASMAEANPAPDLPPLFAELDRIQKTAGVSAIALFDEAGTAIAWGGDHRGGVPAAARLGTVRYLYQEGPLYSYLYFIRRLPGGYTATAAFLLEASAEGGAGLAPFAERFEARFGTPPGFWTPDHGRPESIWDWATDEEGPILSVTFPLLSQQNWWLQTADTGRGKTAVFILAAFALLSVLWYRAGGRASGVPVAVGTAAAMIAPVGGMIGAESLFSPLRFVLPGPFDISLGTLLILLVGVSIWALTRTAGPPRLTFPARWGGVILVVLFPLVLTLISRSASGGLLAERAAGGFALQLAMTLLLAIPIFLVLRNTRPVDWRGAGSGWVHLLALLLPPVFGITALLVWSPERNFPVILTAVWAVPPFLAAVTVWPRSTSGTWRHWVRAVWFAGTAALSFLWPMHMRAELDRAERELAVLGVQPDPFLDFLLRQFAESTVRGAADGERGVNLLYRGWVESNLALEGYEARLGLWRGGEPVAELNLSELGAPPDRALADIRAFRTEAAVVHYGGLQGLHYLLIAPLGDGTTVSVAVPPRRRLGGSTSLARFLHPGQDQAVGQRGEALDFVSADSRALTADESLPISADTVHWVRTAEGWRSETIVRMPEGDVHAHFALATPSIPMMMTRALLVITAISLTLMMIWFLSRMIRGELSFSSGLGPRWLRSFRGRLSVALFVFFLLPTIAFGAVSYSAVAREVIRSAASIAARALEQAAENPDLARFGEPGSRSLPDLLLYTHGTLTSATVPEVLDLGLFHTWVPAATYLQFVKGEEIRRVDEQRIADSDYLVAYRRIDADRTLAAPTPLASSEITERQLEFRDIVLLVILLGLIFSIVMSVAVGRALVRPLDELSRAATTVGGGDLETRLPSTRGDEFGNVYESFNRMVRRIDRTRSALIQETRRSETIVAQAAAGVLALDAYGRVELINPRAAEILGGTVGTGDILLDTDQDSGELARTVATLMNTPAPEARTELDIDGRTVRMRLRRLSPDEEGGGGGAVIAVEDLTAEMRTARVLAWGEMARQVAHEIKNPLTPIKLSVQHLRRAFEDRRPDFDRILDRNVGSILREIDRLSEISRAFARFGTPGAVASPLESVDIDQAIREVSTLYHGSDGGTDLQLISPPVLPRVVARAGEVKEVFLNLLENAREAVDPGTGRILISIRLDSGEADPGGTGFMAPDSIKADSVKADSAEGSAAPRWIRIDLEDNGVGIPPEQLPSIFEPHFSTRSSGTGLGLAIVKRIVESWGGRITVTSEPGEGARFTILLRVADGTAAGDIQG
ncbi:MAG: HAMP domain-containing protein [Gemmatimonadota bacterium]|nr:HAMP domain-containing protein [Gemmatimonadota bacterium]